ncbi:MAG: hypothetical protein M1818_006721 [Claussenomyces sp. TS43310]|nr:MAG: hypothetical protein M1818_006721 [Claussenomyces sp. TS43310]
MAPLVRIRPYKDFLTPALHRRFSKAAVALLGLCYVEAILLGQWDSLFWSWFPFGLVGIRTGLLFICAFSIFVLRVAQLHVGLRTTSSEFQTFKQYALRFETAQTAVWYLFSAWLYSEVYIYSASSDANIRWITGAKNNERPRLNERPIYLTSYFILLSLVQTGNHLAYDYDRVDMPGKKSKSGDGPEKQANLNLPPSAQLKAVFPALITKSTKRSLTMSILGPIIYYLTIRQYAWTWTLTFARLVWSLPRSTAIPPISPFHWRLLLRTFTGGFLLTLMWEFGNAAFSAYVAQEPLKNDRPITYESRDPNGSLLTGLKGKRLQTRAFAFWELVYIAERYQGRRKTIYEDIDRVGGSTWSQILGVCLSTINGMNDRITLYLNPPLPASTPANTIAEPGLPRLTSGLQAGDIVMPSLPPKSTSKSIAHAVGSIAKEHGQSPSEPLIKGRRLLNQAKSAVLTPEQERSISPDGIWAVARQYALQALQGPVGGPFRQEFRRRVNTVVLGSPHGELGILVDAVDALTRLTVCSLREDPYGNVQKDIPTIIRTFTVTIERLEIFTENLSFHWTDIEKRRECPEVDTILTALKDGLQELLLAFGDYAEDLKLSQTDMRTARQAAAPKKRDIEMKESGR